MLERLATKWANLLIAKGADPENKEIYAYALESILSNAISYGILIILAAFLRLIPQMMLFFLFWIPLRSNFGGIHASSQARCFFLSALFGVGSVLMAINFIPNIIIILICLAVSILLAFKIAPVIHPNHPVSDERQKYVKKIVRIVVVVESVVIIILYFVLPPWISSIGMYSTGFAVLFGLLGKMTNKQMSLEKDMAKKYKTD